MRLLLIITAIFTFTVGCSTSVYTLDEEERRGITFNDYKAETGDLFSISLEYLQNEGYIIENTDRETGLITTDWKQSESITQRIFIGDSRSKVSVNVREIEPEISRVNVQCQLQSEGSFGSWEQQKITKNQAEDLIQPLFDYLSQYHDLAE